MSAQVLLTRETTAQSAQSTKIDTSPSGATLEDYAQSLGVTASYVDGMGRAWLEHRIEVAQMAGFTRPELDALFYQGMELVRSTHYEDAANVFLLLCQLDRTEARHFRGLALAFHCLREFGWSRATCEMALRRDPTDIISHVLYGEATLYLRGKRDAHKYLSHISKWPPKNGDEQLYIERAKQILAKIRITPAVSK